MRLQSVAGTAASDRGWAVTPEKVDDAVRQIVEIAKPLRVVAFGSWARGQSRPDSDLDLAVILDGASDAQAAMFLRSRLAGITMSMDILAVPLERFERFRHSVNSVHYDIQNEGKVLYERNPDGSASGAVAA
jgi:predicted nucleotidyltransferase